jgi:hypothetical protein
MMAKTIPTVKGVWLFMHWQQVRRDDVTKKAFKSKVDAEEAAVDWAQGLIDQEDVTGLPTEDIEILENPFEDLEGFWNCFYGDISRGDFSHEVCFVPFEE